MFDVALTERLTRAGVVAVLTVDDADDAVPIARALLAGGVTSIELTFRTAAAPEAIKRIRGEVPEVLVGAGTVLNARDVGLALGAGAFFGVAPGCNPNTLKAAKERGLAFAPGVATPSDIERALENGCRVLKFFPAQTSGGLAHLTTMAAPYAHLGVKFIPLGGITEKLLPDYLRSPLVACVGGSWLASSALIRAKDWPAVQKNAAEAMRTVSECRDR
ncbi:MAG TPA: bifunctional 4-hydroxy-2-oxoglutarate aldolase/2-dehydro-3-deoxy-phosphogluconate aldolase [Opitutaceae bacterium]|jgi:2-dehydro-3-deoxyphosphogluconate aldolase/(4S)-4-hydroxy-2-oxoglutarate aldolase